MSHLGLLHLITFFGIVLFISPVVQLLALTIRRAWMRRRIVIARRTKVIDVIHHMETGAILGVPFVHWISMPLTRETARAVMQAPPALALDIIVHVPGGVALGAEAVCRALLPRTGKVTLIVPQYALSGALLLALAADEILMDEEAALGALDLRVDGRTAAGIMLDRGRSPRARQLLRPFPTDWQRDQPLNADALRQLGFNVTTELPPELRRYLTLYRQPPQERPWPFLIRLPESARRP
jgi:hypothetical protein